MILRHDRQARLGLPPHCLPHRALLLAAVSDRDVTVTRPLESADTEATRTAVEACRVRVEGELGDAVTVSGRGLRALAPPDPAPVKPFVLVGAGPKRRVAGPNPSYSSVPLPVADSSLDIPLQFLR